MAVIINDLEVVVEPPPPKTQANTQAMAKKPLLTPLDFLSMRERELRNCLRLVAH